MIDAEEAEARAGASAAAGDDVESRQAPPSANGSRSSALASGNDQRRVDVEETGHELDRQSPDLVGNGVVDLGLPAERVAELVRVKKAGGAPRSVDGSDAPSRPLRHGRAVDGPGKLAEQADELAEREGPALGSATVDDGLADVHLLESENEVGRGHTRRRERAAAVSGQVESPSGTDRVSLGERGNTVEVDRSNGGHVDGKVASQPSHEGGGQRAAKAVPRADENEREPVFHEAGIPPEKPRERPRRAGPRATLAGQTALRSGRVRSQHLQQDDIPADSEPRGLMTEAFLNRPASLADYLTILRRRIWMIVIPLVLAPIVAYYIAHREKPVYQASASVVFNFTPATLQALGGFNQNAGDPTRYLETEATTVARDARLLGSVAPNQMSAAELASVSSVAPSALANLLIFTVKTGDSGQAAALANAYARAFSHYATAKVTKQFVGEISSYHRRIRKLRAEGRSKDSPDVALLRSQLGELEAGLAGVPGSAPQVAQTAGGAAKVSPRPTHNAMLGLALGLVIGIGLAFLAEALDKRVRSEREVEDMLGLPLLARLPAAPRRLRRAEELPILVEPRTPAAEAIKKLRTNLEFVNLERKAQVLMITSALEQEGKSTTLAGLAVALARAGRRVALVDLDLRKPYLHRFFHIGKTPGVTEVITGRRELSDTLKPILIPGSNRVSSRPSRNSGSHAETPGMLAVLPAGTPGPDPAFLVDSPEMAELIEQLRGDWDIVLLDAPPLPAVDDGLALSAIVDAVLVVVRSGAVPRRVMLEMSRLLDTSPADSLGFVLTGLHRGEARQYGYGYGYGHGHDQASSNDASPVIQAPTQERGERRRSAWSQR
jgi:polysaccharide biosynthesis transport protein